MRVKHENRASDSCQLLCLFLLMFMCLPTIVKGQSDAMFAHIDSFAVGTDTTDIFFGTLYQQATVKVEGANMWLIPGAPDTTSWSTRDEWIYMVIGETISFGTLTKLRALRVKTDSGSGVLYVVGAKKERQYAL